MQSIHLRFKTQKVYVYLLHSLSENIFITSDRTPRASCCSEAECTRTYHVQGLGLVPSDNTAKDVPYSPPLQKPSAAGNH